MLSKHTLTPIHIEVAAWELCQHLADIHVGFRQLGNDPVHCVAFLRRSESPFRSVRPSKVLALTMVQFYGGRISLIPPTGIQLKPRHHPEANAVPNGLLPIEG